LSPKSEGNQGQKKTDETKTPDAGEMHLPAGMAQARTLGIMPESKGEVIQKKLSQP